MNPNEEEAAPVDRHEAEHEAAMELYGLASYAQEQEVLEALVTLQEKAILPCVHLSVLLFKQRCALVGCSISVLKSTNYCSTCHQTTAEVLSSESVPLLCAEGFLTYDQRAKTCSSCLLLKISAVETGVPTLKDHSIFTTHPSELALFKHPEVSADWLFFQAPPPAYTEMVNRKLKWQAGPRKVFTFDGCAINITSFSIRSSVRADKKKEEDETEEDKKEKVKKQWVLYLFQYSGFSLYCLAYDSLAKEPKLDKKPNNKSNDKKGLKEEDKEEDQGKEKKRKTKQAPASSSGLITATAAN